MLPRGTDIANSATMQLAWKIFLAILVAQAIGWVGKKVLIDLAFSVYASLFLSSFDKRQRALKKSILATKAELSATSSQDQFAKWAKLKRKIDKELAELEKLNATLSGSRAGFDRTCSSAIWILTFALPYVLVWYHRKEPVFYLPDRWAPPTVAWLMSASGKGRFLRGSVSTTAWSMVCRRVIATSEELVADWFPQNRFVRSATTTKPTLARPVDAKTGGGPSSSSNEKSSSAAASHLKEE